MMTARIHHSRNRNHRPTLATALALIGLWAAPALAADVWIEGEAATVSQPAGFKPQIQRGPSNVLSEGRWLTISVDSGKVERAVPANGVGLVFAVPVASRGNYHVWMHLGFEASRAPFAWRLDRGAWQKVGPDVPTVDVREIGVWAPVAWLDLGAVALARGQHRLEVRVGRPEKSTDGKSPALLFGCDAFCLSTEPFHPEGTIHRGDTTWQTAADKAAAAHVFALTVPNNAAQTAMPLAGTWQYAGDDETVVDGRLEPIHAIPDPATMNWHAIAVPGDRNQQMPGETYVHRYYLRTRVQVPAELAGRSFVLHVPGMSVVASVLVNGRYCGGTKNCWAVWDCDLTQAIRPGEVNEVVVAFKDAFYALAGDKHPHKLDYIPYSFWHYNTTRQLLSPILVGERAYPTGFVLGEPSLVVAGSAYTADVFAIPSVKNKTLGLEITLHNPTPQATTVDLDNEIVPLTGGAAEKTFATRQVHLPAGKDVVVKLSEAWTNPKLWWPDDPQQYHVVTRLSVAGKVIDERTTKFGFREWSYDGPRFKLNGVPWYGFADAAHDTHIESMKRRGMNMTRIWWQSPETEDFQNDCDAKGLVVRRTGTFDGEGVGGFFDVRRDDLWENYREQMAAWIKGLRNHPSIFLWSIENEITFINGHVTGNDSVTTRQVRKSAEAFKKIDPTRASMVDGGNALLDESLGGVRWPLHGAAHQHLSGRLLRQSRHGPSPGMADHEGQAHYPGRSRLGRRRGAQPGHRRRRTGLPRQGRGPRGDTLEYPDALRGLPLERHQRQLLDERDVPARLQALAAGRGSLPAVGLDFCLRRRGEAHAGHLQQHALRRPDHPDLDSGLRRREGGRGDHGAQHRARRRRQVRSDAADAARVRATGRHANADARAGRQDRVR